MERDLEELSLNDEEDEVVEAQKDPAIILEILEW